MRAGREGHVHSGPGMLGRQSEGEGKRCVLHGPSLSPIPVLCLLCSLGQGAYRL